MGGQVFSQVLAIPLKRVQQLLLRPVFFGRDRIRAPRAAPLIPICLLFYRPPVLDWRQMPIGKDHMFVALVLETLFHTLRLVRTHW